ncbi:glucose 1-dehydrogenase [Actinomadura barringtoniae]|uniref:Glucose 1-dehydrogenase n=1 Tax=Actinomadura barringtoniae TaxID=1427535 RepID=A0A939PHS1_9ACTN|nr:glucose 1-dehydrogenase [Actinomadura barringtoniae]MBO2449419.1 glucose 1-dehydrogenase [Actinomadura barringtoniae]
MTNALKNTALTGRFEDRIALITGGSSGMGLAAAARLLSEGAHVIITGRDQARLDAAVKELDAGDRVLAVRADAADLNDLDAVAATIKERYGRLDVVFANAGVGVFSSAAEVTEDDFDHIVGVNFKGVFFTVQKSLPLMKAGGSIVINASWTLNRGLPIGSVYSASKAAAHNLSRTFAAEFGPAGIRVNSVSPGFIDTPMFQGAAPSDEERDAYASQVVSGRLGTSEDIADAVAFLASDEASYINGQDLIIDGGLVAAIPGGN